MTDASMRDVRILGNGRLVFPSVMFQRKYRYARGAGYREGWFRQWRVHFWQSEGLVFSEEQYAVIGHFEKSRLVLWDKSVLHRCCDCGVIGAKLPRVREWKLKHWACKPRCRPCFWKWARAGVAEDRLFDRAYELTKAVKLLKRVLRTPQNRRAAKATEILISERT